jgi:hypothetical protein
MANNFRENPPKRNCTKTYAKYGSFKPYLAKDFLSRCGYTDCPDFWFGGANNFHIDHFVPWKNYPAQPNLKTDYSNLVYCCSYVNILKSNDEGNYIDPCNVDFNQHFTRDIVGNILPVANSVQANYMYKKLKLFMKRYQIIWTLENIFNKMKLLKQAIENTPDSPLKNDLLIANGELGMILTEYLDYLRKNQ